MVDNLHLHLFGSPQFTYQDKPIIGFVSNKARALLIYLAVTGRAHSREALAELLWADKAATRRDNLKKTLNQLRNHDAIPLQEEGSQSVALDLNRYWVDVVEFEGLISNRAANDVDARQRAVDLYQDDFLTGFNLSLSVEFEEWALGEQARLKAQMVALLHQLTDEYAQRNEVFQATTTIRRLLQLEPWSEEAHRQLMALWASSGERSAALKQFDLCCQILRAELNVAPDPRTVELAAKIRNGTFDTGAGQSSRSVVVPATKQIAAPARHNLPAPTTPLIGREQEFAQLAHLLDTPTVRLITVLGAGGMGKTRLALAVAAARREAFRHGVYFVALAPLSEPEVMISSIAASVGYTFQTGDRSPKAQLLDHLRAREMLLLLDNAEHLLAGVSLFTEILQVAPNVRLLVTSRERLRLSNETVFALEGLALSDSIYAGDDRGIHDKPSAALQLFLQSAQRVRPSFSPTATDWAAMVELCRLVGGMPLGLILAASWIEMLAPVEIVQEINQSLDFLAADLHDLPERHRSLRAIFNTTWQQLAARERDVFRKLSVFRGGFTREAAEAVTGASLATLTALIHKSLIQVQPNRRYEIHELLRQFAWETVAEEGVKIRDAHSTFYCTFLAQRTVNLKGARQQTAIAEIEADGENVRMAWQWAVQRGQVKNLTDALDSLCLFYQYQNRFYEGEAMCKLAVDRLAVPSPNDNANGQNRAPQPARVRFCVRVCIGLSIFQRRLRQLVPAQQTLRQAQQGLVDAALIGLDTRREQAQLLLEKAESVYQGSVKAADLAQQSLALFRTLNDPWHIAQALELLGRASQVMGLVERAKEAAEEGLALRQTLGDTRGIADSLRNLSNVARWMGRFEEAEELINQSIEIFAALNDQGQQAIAIHTLAGILVHGGRFTESFALFEESLSLHHALDLPGEPGSSTVVSGFALLHLGRYDEALPFHQKAIALYPAPNNGYPVKNLGRTALANRDYREAQPYLLEALSLFHHKDDMNGVGQVLGCLGYLAVGQGNVSQAQEYICGNLQLAADTRLFLPSMTALAGIALLHAAQEDHTAAVEIYTVALQNPHVANSRWFHDVVGQQIDAVAATLSPDVVAAAQARGRAQDWRSTVPQLLLAWDKLFPHTGT